MPAKSKPAKRGSPRRVRVLAAILGSTAEGSPRASPTSAKLIEWIREGLPASELQVLKEALEVSNETLSAITGVSKATLSRRRPGQRLSPGEGDRIVRFARLYALAVEVMGTTEHARLWMKSPQAGLGGETPMECALTELGARDVEDLLGRIEHGVYS